MKTINEKYRLKGDKVIWAVYIVFIIISLMWVFSSMGKTVYEKQGGNITLMLFKHFFLLLSGFALCYISHLINYVNYSRISKPALYFSFILLIFTLLYGFVFTDSKAASRWISIPLLGQFQPSEIVKYIIIIYTSTFLANNAKTIKDKQTFINIVTPIILICGLIFPENFSTAALIGLVCYILLLVGGINRRYYFTSIVVLFVALGLFMLVSSKVEMFRSSTWSNRIEEFRNPDKMEINQTNIALMAISTGGITGKFIGNTEHARFLSESHNDFIFAIILEEGGLWMCLITVTLYIVLLFRMLRISKNAKGDFGALLALGIALVFTLQTIINMMVATNLMPVTGQTLPFISYGGTSFWFSSFALGIVLNISRKENQNNSKLSMSEEEEIVNDDLEINNEELEKE
ncbi:MAG: FtsW/RodA/SpoVE family cell cycle protein [Synergistales bacterium]|nr:FtsW/RodA/SpoVE family cell cycle protein [Bacteroidales bacterium]MDY6435870.1 FtsW/RodA/SpoVE family cell cycle protein [Synergistales bacterium]MEE3413640.1 FtsW/RodA/SpoVE family cell cycle protein [Bacteroidales bacterium]